MKKVTTGLALTAILVAIWAVRGPALRLLFGCSVFAAAGEMIRALTAGGHRPVRWPAMIYAALSMPVYLAFGTQAMWPLLALFVLLGMTAVVLRGEPDLDALCVTVLPVLFPGGLFSLIYPLQDIADPYWASVAVGLAFLSAFMCDIFAWGVGRKWGRHALCPALSPKKTVEGAVAGLFGSVVAVPAALGMSALLMKLVWHAPVTAGPPIVPMILASVIAGAFSQAGDLSASLIKRSLGIKDYGSFLPGHGGVMDRIDSLVFSSVIIYIYFVYGVRAVIV